MANCPEPNKRLADELEAYLARREADITQETAFLEAGYAPERGNKMVFFRVPKQAADMFESSNLPLAERIRTFGMADEEERILNVLPQLEDGESVLYALEAPESGLPTGRLYSDEAKNALGVLRGGKAASARLPGYKSGITMPEDLPGESQFFRVPDELRASLPGVEELNTLSPQDKASRLRQALIYNYDMPAQMAEGVAKVRQTARGAKDAARRRDQVEAVEQSKQNEAAALEMLEGAVEASEEARDQLRAAILAKVAAQEARRAPIHPPNPEAWRRVIKDLAIADITELPSESMLLSDIDKKLTMIVSRRTRQVPVHEDVGEEALEELVTRQTELRQRARQLVRQLGEMEDPVSAGEVRRELGKIRGELRDLPDPQRAEAQLRVRRDEQGFPVTTEDEYFDVTIINRNGEELDYRFEGPPIVAGQASVSTAADNLATFIGNAPGFSKSPVEFVGFTNWISESDPRLVAMITHQKARTGGSRTTRGGPRPGGEAYVVRYHEVTDEGTLRTLNKEEMPFKRGFTSEEAARQSLEQLGFRPKQSRPYHYYTELRRIKQELPDPTAAGPRDLHRHHAKLTQALLLYIKDHRVLSRDLKEYIKAFGRAWVQTGLKRSPFNAKIRDAVGAVTIEDLRPRTFERSGRGLGGGQVSKGTGALGKQGPAGEPDFQWSDSWVDSDVAPDVPRESGEGTLAGGNLTGPWPEEVWLHAERPLHLERIQEWKELLEQQHALESIADVEPVIRPEPNAQTLAQQSYAELGDGRQVLVVDPDVGSGNMLVSTFDGQSFVVPINEAKIVRGARRDLYWAKLKRVAEGEPAGIPEPLAAGLGEWEKKVGLLGVPNRAVIRDRMRQDLERMLEGVKASRAAAGEFKGKQAGPFKFRGSDDQFEEIAQLYRRAHELDVADVVKDLPETLQRPLKWSVYKAMQAEQGNHPVADLAARALLGEIDATERKIINAWAGQYGLSGVSTPAQIQGLIDRGQIDYQAAKLMFQLKNDVGRFGWWGDGPTTAGRVVLRDRSLPNDLWQFGRWFSIPHKAARRHPTANGMISSIYKAVENEARYREKATQLFLDLEGMGIKGNTDDLVKLRGWVEQYRDWEEAAAGGVPKRFAQAFSEMKQWLKQTKWDVVWLRMKRGFQARPIRRNADGSVYIQDQARLSQLGPDLGIDLNNPPADFMIMDDLRRDVGIRSDDEIDEFIHYLQTYNDAGDLAKGRPGVPGWMVEQFDFWKNWEIKNYWPYVHEGNFVIYEVVDNKQVTRGFALSLIDGLELIRYGAKSGKWNKAGKFGLREIAPIYDDVLQQIVPPNKYQRVVSSISKATSLDPDEVSAILTAEAGALAPGPSGKRAPWLAHAEKRLADLRPLKDNPVLEILLYNSRIARAKYKHEILSALDRWQSVDAKLSRAFGVDPLNLNLFAEQQFGPWKNLAYMMRDQIDSALGQYTWQDQIADFMIGLRNMMVQGPREFLRYAKGDSPLPLSEIFKAAHYTRPFDGRRYAQDIIALQSMLKLGASPMSAFVNLTQTLINVAPKIGTARVLASLKDTGDFLFAGSNFSKFKRLDSDEYLLFKELVDDAGITYMPSKQVAGAGWADQIGERPRSLMRLDPAAFDPTNSMSGKTLARLRRTTGVAFDWTQYASMYLFNKAENINRISTLLGGYKYARAPINEGGLGLAEEAARAYAKQLVVDTQFLYTTQAMPIFMKGPIARVLFQFKPFVVNQLSYEYDLVKAMLRGDTKAWKGMFTHLAWYSVFGGMRGLMNHPVLLPISAAAALLGKGTLEDHILARNRHEKDANSPDLFTGSANWSAKDAAIHGVFGLLGGSLGQRIGVSGQELTADNFIMGPHTTAVFDWYRALFEYMQSGDTGPAKLGWLAGLATVPATGGNRAYQVMVATALGAHLGSQFSLNPMHDFVTDSRLGRRAWQSFLPSQATRTIKTLELFAHGSPRDISFRPLHQPWAVNKTEHALWTLLGGATIDDAEARAYQALLLSDGERYRSRRSLIADELATALVRGDIETYHRIAINAAQRGIVFDPSDLQDRIERMVVPALESVSKAQPVGARLPFLK